MRRNCIFGLHRAIFDKSAGWKEKLPLSEVSEAPGPPAMQMDFTMLGMSALSSQRITPGVWQALALGWHIQTYIDRRIPANAAYIRCLGDLDFLLACLSQQVFSSETTSMYLDSCTITIWPQFQALRLYIEGLGLDLAKEAKLQLGIARTILHGCGR